MLELPRWLGWNFEWREKQKRWAKQPCNPVSGVRAEWQKNTKNFDDAYKGAKQRRMDGIGFSPEVQDGLVFVDFDDCVKEDALDEAVEKWIRLLPSYTEITPSGEGLRIVVAGKIPRNVTNHPLPDSKFGASVELYAGGSAHYVTVTGKRTYGIGLKIAEAQAGIDALLDEIGFDRDEEENEFEQTTERSEDATTEAAAIRYLERAIAKAETITEGRYSFLVRTCWWLGRVVGANPKDQRLTFDNVREKITEAIKKTGWTELHHVKGQLRAGMKRPVTIVEEEELPAVLVVTGKHTEAIDKVEEVLVANAKNIGLFQRAGEIVQVISLPEAKNKDGLRKPAGTIVLNPVSHPGMLEIMERIVAFKKYKSETDGKFEIVNANCPDRLARNYLAMRGKWKLPALSGTISAPLMRLDGTILDAPGYDEKTGLYLVANGNVAKVSENPTRDDAHEAFEFLWRPFWQFPFESDADKSIMVASIITAIERRLLEACPMFGFSAPAPRSGKSLLAESTAIIATGKPAPASSVSGDREEFRKALTAALREGCAIMNLDNIERPLKSADLCKIITQGEFSDRLLGETTVLRLPTNIFLTATGNNLTLKGDLANRAIVCRIDAKIEKPETRKFEIANLELYLIENRHKLIAAALTILRAFVISNQREEVETWGGFTQWSRFVREAIIFAGGVDPCLTRNSLITDDPEKESADAAFEVLAKKYNENEFTVSEVVYDANLVTTDPKFKEAISAVTGGRKEIESVRFGWWLRNWRGRIVNGMRLERTNDEASRPARWRVGRS